MLVCSAVRAKAGVVAVQPASPTSADAIRIELSTPFAELELQPVVITGTTIEITFRGAPFVQVGGGAIATIGPLPPGVYTIVVRHVIVDEPNGAIVQTITEPPTTLVIAPAHVVPTLEWWGMALLVIAVAAAGLLTAHR